MDSNTIEPQPTGNADPASVAADQQQQVQSTPPPAPVIDDAAVIARFQALLADGNETAKNLYQPPAPEPLSPLAQKINELALKGDQTSLVNLLRVQSIDPAALSDYDAVVHSIMLTNGLSKEDAVILAADQGFEPESEGAAAIKLKLQANKARTEIEAMKTPLVDTAAQANLQAATKAQQDRMESLKAAATAAVEAAPLPTLSISAQMESAAIGAGEYTFEYTPPVEVVTQAKKDVQAFLTKQNVDPSTVDIPALVRERTKALSHDAYIAAVAKDAFDTAVKIVTERFTGQAPKGDSTPVGTAVVTPTKRKSLLG